jgi:hypothetical protein
MFFFRFGLRSVNKIAAWGTTELEALQPIFLQACTNIQWDAK